MSAIGWGCFCGAMIACAIAFSIPTPALGGLSLAVLTNLGSMIPSSPGSIGVYHALAVLGLTITETVQELGLAVAVASHALIVGTQLVIGLAAFLGWAALCGTDENVSVAMNCHRTSPQVPLRACRSHSNVLTAHLKSPLTLQYSLLS
jgi:hypothetical protein